MNDRPAQRSRAWTIGIDVFVILILLLTAAATRQVSDGVLASQDERLADHAAKMDAAMEQKFQAYEQVLLGVRGLLISNRTVTREMWTGYVDSLRLDDRYPGIKSLAFLAAVPTDKLADFTAAVRRERAPADLVDPQILSRFTVRPVDGTTSVQPMAAPILYIAPSTNDNNVALGADPMQEPTRHTALTRATSTDDVVVTPRVFMGRFAPDGTRLDDRVGVIAYLAVAREGQLVGWVTAAFRTEEFLTGMPDGDADFEIVDSDGGLLYSTRGVDANGSPVPLGRRDSPEIDSELTISDQHWEVRYFAGSPLVTTAESIAPGLIGFGGIVLAVLVGLIGRSGAGWRARATLLARSEAAVRHQATHDHLTGLPNRSLFHSRLTDTVVAQTPFTLAYIDIDGFKTVNDENGHRVGDALLIAIAGRLRSHVGRRDTVARLGGDEFAIIHTARDRDDYAMATELVRHLSDPYSISLDGQDRLVHVGASIGLAQYPADGATGDELVHAADVAMLDAKRAGRGQVSLASAHRSRGGLAAVPDSGESLD